MIDSIGPGLSASFLTNSAASISSASAKATASGQQTGETPAQAGLGDLTAADWKLVSAAAGKNVGPDASGHIGPVPLLAAAIQMERQGGNLSAGQELTVGDLQQMGANQPAKGYVEQINNAISYLEENAQTSVGSSAGRAVNFAA